MGQSFASRVAASLLNACGLTELITESRADYEKLAIELARHPTKLATIRAKLIANRDKHPLFDTVRYAKNLETALETIIQLANDRKPPASFTVIE